MMRNDEEIKESSASHNERVREILGDIPEGLVRWGMAVILLVLLGLILAVILIPYPYSNGESILQHILN